MANSLSLRITNIGSSSSIYISDIHDGKDQNGRVNNRKPYQYVPANGSVVVLFTEQVKYSYENGAIRSFINQGIIETFFVMGDLNLLSTDEDGSYKLNVSYESNTFYLRDNTNSDVGTNINVKAGNSVDETGGDIQLQGGNSNNNNGGYIGLTGGEGTSGGDVTIYGGRGSTGTAGDIILYAGDKPTGNGGSVNIYGGPAWVAGAEAGGVNIYGGNSITTGEASISGSILIEAGGIGNPGVGGWVNTGGDVTIKSGLGNGAGHSSGDVILEPVAGAGGASDGKVVIKGSNATLEDYTQDGVLSVYGGDGTIISNPYGRIETSLLNGDTLTGFAIPGAFITLTQVIIVTLEYPNVANLVLNKPAHITSRVLGVNANVELELVNNSGAEVTVYLNWMVLGA